MITHVITTSRVAASDAFDDLVEQMGVPQARSIQQTKDLGLY